MNFPNAIFSFLAATVVAVVRVTAQPVTSAEPDFVNFETAPVHPVALSPDGSRLAVCNLAAGRLEVFDVTTGLPRSLGSTPVGLDPVSVRFRGQDEAWVVNHISDSISVVDIASLRVVATIRTLDTPEDVVFAGSPQRAFVSCAMPNTIQVFDPSSRQLITNVVIEAERPRALAVSPDGRKVYAAIFESGNATTLIGARFRNLLFIENAVSRTNGPYAGQNPPPNSEAEFNPPPNPAWPTNLPPPRTGVIVRKNSAGRWLDGNQRDWTVFVSGTNAALTQRIPGWDLPDRDLAVLDTVDLSVSHATGLMNICMALDVNPVSGRIAVTGTDAINEVRFEANLNGIFVRVKLAMVDPADLGKSIGDLNPHLDYLVPTVSSDARNKSIGDPRGIAWTSDGTRGYVAGMGSRNLIVIDANGNRLSVPPIEVGEGPCGLAVDEAHQRLYVFNRFSSSLSVVDTENHSVVAAIALFDPTPVGVSAGRRHLYDTRRTSGLGQASCASCHVDARMDRLGWDLGNPAGEILSAVVNHQTTLATNSFHPMKGVMVTQTLQDIIGREPFHWRGDRPSIESFNSTYTNLHGAAAALTPAEMAELREFLSTIRFPPNPFRNFDNSMVTNLPLRGHVALGDGVRPAGTPLPNGNAVAGLAAFNQPGNFCTTCHTLPTGLGLDSALQGGVLKPLPTGPNDEHHFPLAFRLEGDLRSKISQFRNMADKIGMEGTRTQSRAGFGFGHDGSVDSLTRFLNGLRIVPDEDVANLIALLLSVSGSDLKSPGGPEDPSPPSAVGRQLTLSSSSAPPIFDAMLTLARAPTSRVDLIAKGRKSGLPRGWFFDRTNNRFQSDRHLETDSPLELLALAGSEAELTMTIVARGTGRRLGIDQDSDGILDRDELDQGSDPADPPPQVVATALREILPLGADLQIEARIRGLPAPLSGLTWRKDGQPIPGATNRSLVLTGVSFDAAGDYSILVETPFQTFASRPVSISVVPLLVAVTPTSQSVRPGSNVTFTAVANGAGPFLYHWEFKETAVPGGTASTFVVTNAQLSAEGSYRVVAANAFGSVTSGPAALGLLINPAVVVPPVNQTVVEGGNATFSVMVSGHPPPFGYLLRKSATILTNYTSIERAGFLTLSNVQPGNAGTYRVVVTNAANPSPGLSLDPVTLTVLADTDHDGLPDEWEATYGFGTNDSSDAGLDFDLDGQSNRQEYLAGTNPKDAESFLKVESISLDDAELTNVIQFRAIAGKTYALQSREAQGTGAWVTFAEVVAVPTNRLVSVTNAINGAQTRFFRLATPVGP